MEKKENKWLKPLVLVVIIAVVVLIAKQLGWLKYLSIENIQVLQSFIRSQGFLGYAIYAGIVIIACVFLLPGSILTILAGLTFGPWLGGFLAVTSATIGATVAFLLARYVGGTQIKTMAENNVVFKKIYDGIEANGISFLILTRLVPIFPFNIQNYAYGLTSIKVSSYFIVSLICMAPGSFIYAYIAGQIVSGAPVTKLLVQFGIAGIALFLLSFLGKKFMQKSGIKVDAD